MKKSSVFLCSLIFLLVAMGSAHAALTTIGTAQFGGVGTEYNLIWDNDNNGNSVVWLDYSNTQAYWPAQKTWASGLNSTLTINLDGYTIDWGMSSWRLPTTVDGVYNWSYDGSTTAGYNIISSELGHLFYKELGNLGYYDTFGNYPQTGWGLQNTGDFDNLIASWYWSGTEYANGYLAAWEFNMGYGSQGRIYWGYDGYGLAVRNGQVSEVPVPAAFWFLGSGLVGLIGARRKLKK